MRHRLDRRQRGAQVVRHRREQRVLQAIGLAECHGVFRLSGETHALDTERRIVRDGVEKSPARRIEMKAALVRDA